MENTDANTTQSNVKKRKRLPCSSNTQNPIKVSERTALLDK